MSDQGKTFRHESIQEADVLADHLVEIAEAVRAGVLRLSDESGDLSLQPHGLVRFELIGHHQPDQAGVTITMTWRPEHEVPASSLKISRTTNDGTSRS